MKVLEIRIVCADTTPIDHLLEYGEEAQAAMPADLEQSGIDVVNVTFEVKTS